MAELEHPLLGSRGGEIVEARSGLIEHLGPEGLEEGLAANALEVTKQ